MPRAVRFRRYGGPEVLEVVDVERPSPAESEVLVEVVAAALNPGEIGIREGVFDKLWPARFPEGQGNDFAGVVAGLGPGVSGFTVGDEVLGFAPRAAQAELVIAGADALVAKPAGLDWEQAACVAGVGATAWATVEAVEPRPGETVVVSAAAGGVGIIAAQLARLRGARVIGTAGEGNFALLRTLGIEPVRYGPGLGERITALAPDGVDAYLDNFGDHDVEVALALGVRPHRINTIADGDAVRDHGVRNRAQEDAASPSLWGRLADLAALGQLTIPIAASYELARVQQAYRDVASRHGSGKRVLRIRP
jgi:NADPH:quinone reductase-like Zn-dependent oxidoreductase